MNPGMDQPHPFWSRGFRPFFLGAGLFAIVSMVFGVGPFH